MVLIYYTTENNDLNLHPSEFVYNDLNNAEEAKEVLAKVIKNTAITAHTSALSVKW